MVSAVVLLDAPVWGLLAGKVAADVLFYTVSALGYRVTQLTGVRAPRSAAPTTTGTRPESVSHM